MQSMQSESERAVHDVQIEALDKVPTDGL